MKHLPRKAVFFDRDGIVNKRLMGDYVKSIEQFEFLPGIFSLLQLTREHGYLCILISNQQGVGKGVMSDKDLETVTVYMQRQIEARLGFAFDDLYYCTELASAHSPRRKPQPGMLIEAMQKWYIAPEQSWMIGDSVTDAIAGKRAGCNTLLVAEDTVCAEADWIVGNLEEAFLLLQEQLSL